MRASSRGQACRAVDVFAEFERNLVPFKKLVHEAIEQVAAERTCTHCLPHEGVDAALRAAVRVLLTGAAGFIGARVDAALPSAGHDVVAVDAMLAAAHGPDAEPPPGVQRGRRPRRRRAGAAAARASTWCATRPRWWGPGSTPPTRRPTAATTTTAPRCCSPRCSPRAADGWCWRRRWWSTARAATTARSTGSVDPLPRTRADLDAGVFEHRCPVGGEQVAVAAGRRGRAAAAAQPVCGQQDRAGALRAGVGGGDGRLGRRAALPQRLRPVHAARHPVLRGRRDLPLGAGSGRRAKGFRGRRADAGLRPRRRRRRGQRRGRRRRSSPGFAAFNVCSGRPDLDHGGGHRAVRGPRRRAAASSPASTAAATSATSSPTPPARPRCWDSGPPSTRATGCASSRSRRCGARCAGAARRCRYRHARGVGTARVDVVPAAAVDLLSRRPVRCRRPRRCCPVAGMSSCDTEDGIRLGAWFFPAHRRRGPAVLVCNGNAGDRSVRAPLAAALNRMGLSVLLFDYRGYGGNPGRPSEDGLAADARAAQAWLAAQPEVDTDRIVYFGESLGAAVAVGLAAAAAAGGAGAAVPVHVVGRRRRGALPVAAGAAAAAGPLSVDRPHRIAGRAGAGDRR